MFQPQELVMSNSTRFLRANPGSAEAIGDQLLLMAHCSSCQIGDFDPTEICPRPRCKNMKKILYHSLLCVRGEFCDVEGCHETQSLDKHYDECFAVECAPCLAARIVVQVGERNLAVGRVDPQTAKRKLQIQLLEFVYHIHKCQSEPPDSRMGDCGLPNCEDLEKALLHRPICITPSNCAYPGCLTTGYVMDHWSLCESRWCLVCAPIRLNVDHNMGYQLPLPPRRPKTTFFIKQHIEQLLHVLVCLQRDQDLTEEIHRCPRANCEVMKGVFRHIPECTEKKCKKPQCSSSKRILKHWKTCASPDCVSCVAESQLPQLPQVPPEGPSRPTSGDSASSVPKLPVMYPPGMAPAPLAPNLERADLAQKMMFALLHAHSCSTKSKRGASGLELFPCGYKSCRPMLEIYHHVVECTNYVKCGENKACVLARKLLHHWQTCDVRNCLHCYPAVVRGKVPAAAPLNAEENQEGASTSSQNSAGTAGQGPNGSTTTAPQRDEEHVERL